MLPDKTTWFVLHPSVEQTTSNKALKIRYMFSWTDSNIFHWALWSPADAWRALIVPYNQEDRVFFGHTLNELARITNASFYANQKTIREMFDSPAVFRELNTQLLKTQLGCLIHPDIQQTKEDLEIMAL